MMSGAITDATGNCASQVLIGLGSKVRIDWSCGAGEALGLAMADHKSGMPGSRAKT